LYAAVPHTQRAHSVALFVIVTAIIISMYRGGFSTVPAYLKDLFEVMQVWAIHGRLLTAWSAAGIAGPALVNYIRDYQVAHGVSGGRQYDFTMYLMAGLLVIGFVCNLLVRPVDPKHHYVAAAAGAPRDPDVPVPGTAATAVPSPRPAH
jgi:hypothetical protein